MRTNICGVGFDDLTMDEAVARAAELLASGRAVYAVTPNPEIVWMCRRDADLRSAVADAALVLADGVGIVYGAKILGRPLKARLPGIDFAMSLFPEMAASGKRLFLFGAKPGVAERAAENLQTQFPGLQVCGVCDGYFSDDAPLIAKINAAAPDLLLVCLGAPKQEKWMQANAGKLNAHLMIGLGGSLDVFAGVVERAPEKWQRLGLEWLYRLKKEPRRIKRMMKLPAFLLAVVWQRIRGGS